jgi:hypothetical protein
MFNVSEDLTLHVTRGDNVTFHVTATKDNEAHSFKAGDVVRIKVTEKKDCNKVILQKDFSVETESETATISLTEKDTRIGDTISKPVDYWYEIELNPFDNPQTIIAYDEDGPKVFRLYPEGRDLEDIEIEEDDIPFVDKQLDMTSTRPVENQAIARKFAILEGEIAEVLDDVNVNVNAINDTKATVATHTANKNNPHGVTAAQVKARPDTWMPTAQEVGARPNTWTPTAVEVGARPDTWMPTASQVGARPSNWMPTASDVGAVTETQVNTMIQAQVPNMINDALGVIENGTY